MSKPIKNNKILISGDWFIVWIEQTAVRSNICEHPRLRSYFVIRRKFDYRNASVQTSSLVQAIQKWFSSGVADSTKEFQPATDNPLLIIITVNSSNKFSLIGSLIGSSNQIS